MPKHSGFGPVHPTANQTLSIFLPGSPSLGSAPAKTGSSVVRKQRNCRGGWAAQPQHLTLGPAPAMGETWLPAGFMDQWEQHSSGGVWALLLKVFCLFLQPLLLLSPKSCTFLAGKSPGSLSPALSVTQNQHRGRIPAEWDVLSGRTSTKAEFLQSGCAE